MAYDTDSDNDAKGTADTDAGEAVENASPAESDAHKGMLGEVLDMLQSQGIDLDQLAQQYGLPHVDVDNLNGAQLAQLTQQLATQHPELLAQVAERFPAAQGILGMLTGGGSGGAGGGGLGGILGRLFG